MGSSGDLPQLLLSLVWMKVRRRLNAVSPPLHRVQCQGSFMESLWEEAPAGK